jgi:phosphoribosylformylglycinamidine cyclo-ligase
MDTISYKDSGVDIDAGIRAVELMKGHISRTLTPGVIGGVGGFGAAFGLDLSGIKEPVLVSGTDGVGTKLKIAFMMDKHDTVGIDCVAMCVNDIACMGARPLFFLDYIATAHIEPQKIADIVKGMADGCCQAGCALIGGETAEMPGFYAEGEYDLAGFAVGMVDKGSIINGRSISAGDVLVGLPSSGLHSNGFSLVRKVVFDRLGLKVDTYIDEFGCTLGEELIKPTRIYTGQIKKAMVTADIKGIVHITGGGFTDNIPRVIPEGLTAGIRIGSWQAPPVFEYLAKGGGIPDREMFRTFNMGIGLIMIVSPDDADRLVQGFGGQQAVIIGEVFNGAGGVELWNIKE